MAPRARLRLAAALILAAHACAAASLPRALVAFVPLAGQTSALITITATPGCVPARRQPGQARLTLAASAASAAGSSGSSAIAALERLEQLLTALERARGRALFPLRLDVLPPGAGCVAQFNASSGELLLHPRLLSRALGDAAALAALGEAVGATFARLAGQVAGGAVYLPQLLAALPRALAAGRWFCIACLIVLGLMAPLVINAGLGEAADEACRVLQLSDEACVDLWWAALGLGLALTLASAVPIVKVCRLAECMRPRV